MDLEGIVSDEPHSPEWRPWFCSWQPGTIVAACCCPFCPFVTWSGPAILSHHLRSHIGIQHCSVCGVSAPSTPALHQHIARRHMCNDKTSYHCEDYLTDAPDACLSGCEVCMLVQHYDRRVLSHCCFLCDYADPNPLVLYRHVMIGHVQIASPTEAQTYNEMEADTNHPVTANDASERHTDIYDLVSDTADDNLKYPRIRSKYEPEQEACRHGKNRVLPSPPPLIPEAEMYESPPAMSTSPSKGKRDVGISVHLKKQRKSKDGVYSCNRVDALEGRNTWVAAQVEGTKETTRLSQRPMDHQNGYVITSGMTYSVSFCTVWTPRPSSPPALEQEVPMDLSVRKAPSTDFSQTTLPVISSVFSLKDYY